MKIEIEVFDEVKKALSNLSEEAKSRLLSALEAYVKFTGLNPARLIEEAKADKLKSNPEYVSEERLYTFLGHLLTEQKVDQKLALSHFNDIRSFYAKNGVSLNVSIPRALRYAKYTLGVHVEGIDWLG
ncbi:MAG: hypothetical protein QXV01_08670 [Candidatus Bathyarchaeia archaeon]